MSLVKCRFARRKLNYFRLNALKSKHIMQEPMAMENLLRWFMDGDAGGDKEDSLAIVLANYFWRNMQEQS